MKKNILGVLILIILLGAALRLYGLLKVPPSLYWDEASIAYNAFSIATTGKDEWGNVMPLNFRSFGDYKLPLFVYVEAVVGKLFGFSDLVFRVPSALFGTATIALSYFLVEELLLFLRKSHKNHPLFRGHRVPLISSFLLAISPWGIQFSRAGFEANLALFLCLSGSLAFLLALRRSTRLFLLSFICFSLSFYTYHSAALLTPLFVCTLIYFSRSEMGSRKVEILKAAGVALIFLIPFLPSYVFSAQGRIRMTAESVVNQKGDLVTNLVGNYSANFSTDFLFFKGDQNGRHSVKSLGELYLWQLPTVLVGIYFLLKYKSRPGTLLLLWVLLGALPPTLTRVSPHALRNLWSFVGWQIISAVGLVAIISKFPRLKSCFALVVVYALYVYLHIYWVHYPNLYAADWQDGQRQVVTYLKSVEYKYDHIFIPNDIYPIYVLWYLRFNPNILHASHHNLSLIGKYEYVDLTGIQKKKTITEKDLLVFPEWMGVYPSTVPFQEIKMSNGQRVFRIYEY